MIKLKEPLLFKLVHLFLTEYLPHRRGCSVNTVISYRTALNLFLSYAAKKHYTDLSNITFKLLNHNLINDFLKDLEDIEGNSAVTCNHRLTCIRAFFKYVSAMEPTMTFLYLEIEKVPLKKVVKHTVEYMSEAAVNTLLSIPDITKEKGIRDQFLMIMMYDTGTRVQEILSLQIKNIHTENTPMISVAGKGNKKRSIPLMEQTVKQLQRYMTVFHPYPQEEDYLFYVVQKNQKQKMSDDNVRKLLHKYGEQARQISVEIPKNVYPHLWRHSRAMHLYQNGMDLTLVSQWLGHVQLETTLIYAHADTEHKRKAIQQSTPKDSPIAMNDGNARFCIDDETMLKKLYGLI